MKENIIPTTTRQAFKILDKLVSAEEKAYFLSMTKSVFSAEEHYGLGQWIRNNWIFDRDDNESPEETALRDRCYRMIAGMKEGDYLFEHPDTVSDRFLNKYYDHLKRAQKNNEE